MAMIFLIAISSYIEYGNVSNYELAIDDILSKFKSLHTYDSLVYPMELLDVMGKNAVDYYPLIISSFL